jgi:DNA processing protein
MDSRELRARTAWGLIAEPADPIAWHLQRAWGPEEALARVLESTSASRTARHLATRLGAYEVSALSLEGYRSRYCPERVDRALELQEHSGIVAIAPSHPWWPGRLDDLGERAPSTLWVRGTLEGVCVSRGVAIVGTSAPTRHGRQAALALADVALGHGLALVGGGTRGIATDVHRRAVNAGGISVAVVSGGVEAPYPPDNASLLGRLSQRGALVSEVPSTLEPTIAGLLARNRLLAALATAVVVVQAEFRSGAISVAYHAAALGRHVGVVPGGWHDTRSGGCWRIYRECGAIVLTEPAELSLLIPGVTHPTTR